MSEIPCENEFATMRIITPNAIALPSMIINNIFTNYTRESLISSVVGVLIPFLSMLVTMFAGRLFAKLFRVSKGRVGVFTCMFTFSNAVFIGVPVFSVIYVQVRQLVNDRLGAKHISVK